MNAFDDVVSSILYEMKSVPRLVEANPDIYDHIESLYKPFMIKMREYMTQDLIPNKHYKTNIKITIFDPYDKEKITIPVYVMRSRKTDSSPIMATYNKKERYILALLPDIIEDFVEYQNQRTRFSRLIVHELSHLIDPSFIRVDKILRQQGKRLYTPDATSDKYYFDQGEINSITQEIIFLVKQGIEKGFITKKEVLDVLRRGETELLQFLVNKLNIDERDPIYSAFTNWTNATINIIDNNDHVAFGPSGKLTRELRSRLYGILQAGA